MKAIAVIVVLSMVPAWALATEEVVPVQAGKAAPFTGLLVPEQRMMELLKAEAEVDGLQQKLKIQIKYADSLDAMYMEQLKKATAPEPWYRDPRLHATIGFVVGVAATSLAVFGGVKIVEATR
jgi:hypothetical protein